VLGLEVYDARVVRGLMFTARIGLGPVECLSFESGCMRVRARAVRACRVRYLHGKAHRVHCGQ